MDIEIVGPLANIMARFIMKNNKNHDLANLDTIIFNLSFKANKEKSELKKPIDFVIPY